MLFHVFSTTSGKGSLHYKDGPVRDTAATEQLDDVPRAVAHHDKLDADLWGAKLQL